MHFKTALLSQPVLLGAGFLLLVAVAGAGVLLSRQATVETAWIEHTLQVQRQISNLLLEIRRAESSERGFIISSEPEYFEEYRQSSARIIPEMNELRLLTSDNPVQQHYLDQMRPLVDDRLSEFRTATDAMRTGSPDQAYALIRNGEGRLHTQAIREVADKMSAEEDSLLVARRANSERTSLLLLCASIGGAVIVALLAASSIWLVRRSNAARDAAEKSLIETNENLERIVADRTSDLTEANEEIQRFAYIVSHDLRSPLVNIMGFTSELEAWRDAVLGQLEKLTSREAEDVEQSERETLSRDFDEAIGFIKTSISKMDRLINAVLRLSREGRREFNPERLDMDELIAAIAASTAHQAMEAGAEVNIGKLPAIYSDRLAVEQVFSNLMDNALKYLRTEIPGKIEISGYETTAQAVFVIKDNGRGIDPKDHQRIFDLFRRSGAQDRPGEGIGLAHVRTLMRRLGGWLEVSSELGQGSSFTVTLPRQWNASNVRNAA